MIQLRDFLKCLNRQKKILYLFLLYFIIYMDQIKKNRTKIVPFV